MIRALSFSLAFLSGIAYLAGVSLGHGGTYRGPEDLVPPGGSSPTPGTTAAPGYAGPITPNGGPPTGLRGSSASPTGAGQGGFGRAASTMQVLLQPLDLWQYWWEFNRDPFLNLKAKVYARSVATRSDDFFLGRNRREDARDTDRPSRDEIERTVVPALLEVLRTEKNREVLDSSMIALAKIGGNPSFVDAIAPFLRHDNQTLVETASIALGILAHPDAFSPLESLALDTPEGRRLVGRQEVPFRVRAFATYGLGLLAAARRDTRSSVAGTLVRVLESERSAYKDVSVAASIALGLFEDPSDRAIFALQRVFEDRSNHPLVRAHAPVSIAKSLRKGEATPDVADRFAESFASALAQGEKDESVRGSCVIALGLLADPTRPRYGEVVRALARALHEGSRDMERNFAAIALAEAGGPEAAAALLRALARGRSTIRPWAGIGLGVLCHRARASSAVFPEWGTILERLHEALLEAGNPEDAAAYAIALGLAGDPSSFDPIVSRMRRISEEDSRGYFCTALGLLGDGRARPLLHGEVKDTLRKPHLLRQAAIGLGLLSDHEAVPELLELLRDADTLAVQSAVATALGFIGDARSIPDLLALLRSREHTEFARGFAAVALGMIGDKEDLPWNSKIAVSTNYRALVRTLVGSPMAPGILDIL